MSLENPFIECDQVTLDIPIYDSHKSFRRSLLKHYIGGKILQDAKKPAKISIRALENISFRLEAGDRLGLIGHNGAGKTTLLRVLSGIYSPMMGKMLHKGKITLLTNLSLGVEADETGLENIATIGMYYGMTMAEIKQKQEDIIQFSDLGDYIHLPLRTYSQGMQLRLSFAIATAMEPDILLMDEAIGAGDAQFAEKTKIRLDAFYKRIPIIVVASHSNSLIHLLCNKALLLEHGCIKSFGSVKEVLEIYNHRNVQCISELA